jgi:hypothetical protein
MQIFDYIKNVLFFKKPFEKENMEEIKQYNPFLVNRWISMNDGESANLVNETTNKLNYLGNDKEMHYKMLLNVLPQKKYNRINYIKKVEKLDQTP